MELRNDAYDYAKLYKERMKKASSRRKLQLNELEELKNDAYN